MPHQTFEGVTWCGDDSHSGWLSFYRAQPGAVVERPDNSFGMHRTEVIAKTSGAHLGHVFDDAPGGRRRFCINANVLEFVPRSELPRREKESSTKSTAKTEER